MGRLKMAIFASHGGSNLQSIIDGCKIGVINGEVSVVISNNGNSISLGRAQKENIPYYHMSSKVFGDEDKLDDAMVDILEQHSVNLIVLAGYMKILGPKVLRKYKGRILNIHPALLPKYGGKGMYGRYVHEAVLKGGEKVTGVTIHLVDEEYDSGAIINQCQVKVEENDTVETLASRVLGREHTFYVETLKMISEGQIKL